MSKLSVALREQVAYGLINVLFFLILVLVFPAFVSVGHICALDRVDVRLRWINFQLAMDEPLLPFQTTCPCCV